MPGVHLQMKPAIYKNGPLWGSHKGTFKPAAPVSPAVKGSPHSQRCDVSTVVVMRAKHANVGHMMNLQLASYDGGYGSSGLGAVSVITDAFLLDSYDPSSYAFSGSGLIFRRHHGTVTRTTNDGFRIKHTIEDSMNSSKVCDSHCSEALSQVVAEHSNVTSSSQYSDQSAAQVGTRGKQPAKVWDSIKHNLSIQLSQYGRYCLVSMDSEVSGSSQVRPSIRPKMTAFIGPAHTLFRTTAKALRPLPLWKLPAFPKVQVSVRMDKNEQSDPESANAKAGQDSTERDLRGKHGKTCRYKSARHKLMTVGLATGSTVLALGCALMALAASLVAAGLLVALFISMFVPAAATALPGLKSAANTLIKAGTTAARFIAEMWRLLAKHMNDHGDVDSAIINGA